MANELQSSGNSLSNTWLNRSSSVHNSLLSSKITLTSYIATNKEIFKISSVLELNNNIDQKNHYEIKEELIWKKSFKNLSKNKMFSFTNNDFITSKSKWEDEGFVVSNDLSIFNYFIKANQPALLDKNKRVFDATSLLDQNKFLLGYIDEDYAKYLDLSMRSFLKKK